MGKVRIDRAHDGPRVELPAGEGGAGWPSIRRRALLPLLLLSPAHGRRSLRGDACRALERRERHRTLWHGKRLHQRGRLDAWHASHATHREVEIRHARQVHVHAIVVLRLLGASGHRALRDSAGALGVSDAR